MKHVQTHFLKENLCAFQVFLCPLISRPACARTCAQLRGNVDPRCNFSLSEPVAFDVSKNKLESEVGVDYTKSSVTSLEVGNDDHEEFELVKKGHPWTSGPLQSMIQTATLKEESPEHWGHGDLRWNLQASLNSESNDHKDFNQRYKKASLKQWP